MTTSLDDIVANFELLDEWDDRYRYLIELGKSLEPLPEDAHIDANKVRGCASQVWLVSERIPAGGKGKDKLALQGASDAMIVQGLIAVLFAIYKDKPAEDILALDAQAIFAKLGLKDHLTQQRSNGLAAMVQRIRADAAELVAS